MLAALIIAEVQHAGLFKPCLWGVQDSLGGAKARDFSRPPHSPPISQLHGGASCPA